MLSSPSGTCNIGRGTEQIVARSKRLMKEMAWIENEVTVCSICRNGFLMSKAASAHPWFCNLIYHQTHLTTYLDVRHIYKLVKYYTIVFY